MLAKCLPDDSLCTIAAYSARQYFFSRYYSKLGVFSAVMHKKNLEMPVRHAVRMKNMAITVFAQ